MFSSGHPVSYNHKHEKKKATHQDCVIFYIAIKAGDDKLAVMRCAIGRSWHIGPP